MILGEFAFYRSRLGEISLPNGLTSIGSHAFCTIYPDEDMTIRIPASITEMGDGAFAYNWQETWTRWSWNYRKNLTLEVYSGTYGEQYAIENGLNYEIIG